jgi:hypothetical protein
VEASSPEERRKEDEESPKSEPALKRASTNGPADEREQGESRGVSISDEHTVF